jgi:general transcription factor 3C polypeptide 3 (transcription factor C subunit 4)
MQRQADNRHYMIAQVGAGALLLHPFHEPIPQSLAFLTQYRSIRLKDQANIDEVEFNFGRAFHQIGRLWSYRDPVPTEIFAGLFHHATKHYKRVLDSTERRMKDDPTVSFSPVFIDR